MATVSLPTYLLRIFDKLEHQYAAMEDAFEEPQLSGEIPVFRHTKHSDVLLCFLKGVKLVSTLNACLVLFSRGFVQEMYALVRVVDECCNDIVFMMVPRAGDKLDNNQLQFFDEFFQEEFADTRNVFGSQQKRHRVPRRKVHAAVAHSMKESVNPSDAQNVSTIIHNVYSGYVHGAYPQIMELFGGLPGRFHMKGMYGTPRQEEAARCLIDQSHRAIIISEFVARKSGNKLCADAIHELLVEFETALNCAPSVTPAELMRLAKKKP